MKYTANQAAKATGKSVPTITRAIKSGKLSADRDGKTLVIDAAELFRVFPRSQDNLKNVTPHNRYMSQHVTDENHNNSAVLQREIDLLRERLEDKDALIGNKESVIADLRTDRDHWRDLAETTTRLLPAPDAATPAPKLPWFKRLLGR